MLAVRESSYMWILPGGAGWYEHTQQYSWMHTTSATVAFRQLCCTSAVVKGIQQHGTHQYSAEAEERSYDSH
jgi:hypothetical protein